MSEWWRRMLQRALLAVLAVIGAATLLSLALPAPGVGRRGLPDAAVAPAMAAAEDAVRLAQRIRRAPETPEAPPAPPAPPEPSTPEGPDLSRQSQAEVERKNVGCVSCHTTTDSPTMHTATTVKLACVDCHGGRGDVVRPGVAAPRSPAYEDAKKQAHVRPRVTALWRSAANPV